MTIFPAKNDESTEEKLGLEHYPLMIHPPKFNMEPEKKSPEKRSSSWKPSFSDSMLHFGGVYIITTASEGAHLISLKLVLTSGWVILKFLAVSYPKCFPL